MPPHSPLYSVIIVSYNGKSNLERCLDSLRKNPPVQGGQEIIVVDNDSLDGSADFLREQKDVLSLWNPENRGFSRACNQGAAQASGEFLVFLNPDTQVGPGWLEGMSAYFADKAVGAVGPLSNYVAGLQKIALHARCETPVFSAGSDSDLPVKIANFCTTLSRENRGLGKLTKLLIGFCLMIPRSLFSEMGGMDEDLFLGNDDLDLSWRLSLQKRKLVVATDVFVFHEGQVSFNSREKSDVNDLVKQSTDALYAKLVHYYGGAENVPTPAEIWGMSWFQPSPEAKARFAKAKSELPASNRDSDAAWKSWTHCIYLQGDVNEVAGALVSTLESLPATPCLDVLLLNATGKSLRHVSTRIDMRERLCTESATPWEALRESLPQVTREGILFVCAGVEFSALFNFWFARQADPNGPPLSPLIKVPASGAAEKSREDKLLPPGAWAFAWGRKAVEQFSEAPLLLWRNARPETFMSTNPPVLSGSNPMATTQTESPSWTAVSTSGGTASEGDKYSGFPDSLQSHMRDARDLGLAGKSTETPPVFGPITGIDLEGRAVKLESQDVCIVRVTPEMHEGLPDRLANFRKQMPALRKLIVLIKDFKPAPAAAPEASEADKVRNALWRAGYVVQEETGYAGLAAGAKNLGERGLDESVGRQFIAEPRPQAYTLDKMVSIIILGFNQVDYTRQCIESIQAVTRQRIELILVDNGSSDKTAEYFRSVSGAKVVINAENLGVSRGWNQGLRRAEGDYLLIFNNDTLVTPGWLENMVRLAECHPDIGLVGPRSNVISGPQLIENVPYKNRPELEEFARQWRSSHDLSAWEFNRVTGFCMLIPRRVFSKVGFFDERFGKGNFEDDDYCVRARQYGYRLMVADDSFVHHYGSLSFRSNDSVDFNTQMAKNQVLFQQKWSRGKAALHDTQVSEEPSHAMTTSLSAWRLEIEALLEKKEYPKALEKTEAALRSGEDQGICLNYMGVLALAFGEKSLACRNFELAHAASPHVADIQLNYFDALMLNGRSREALVFANRILSQPALSTPGTEENWELALSRDYLAWALELGEPDAEILFASRETNSRAEKLLQVGQAAEALQILEEFLTRIPNDYQAWNNLGIAQFYLKDFDGALGSFGSSLECHPLGADALSNALDAALKLKCGEGMVPALDIILERRPDARAVSDLREILRKEGRGINAYKNLAQAKALAPYLQAAETKLEAGDLPGAIADFSRVLQEHPHNPRALNGMGVTAFAQGSVKDAFGLFREALKYNPMDQDTLLNLWDAAEKLNLRRETLPVLEHALRIEPKLTGVKTAVAEMRGLSGMGA